MTDQEFYANKARVQLDFKSYMAVVCFIAFSWAFVSAAFSLLLHYQFIDEFDSTLISVFLTICIAGCIGFCKALIAGCFGYPLYRCWCNKAKGQRLSGKFGFSSSEK